MKILSLLLVLILIIGCSSPVEKKTSERNENIEKAVSKTAAEPIIIEEKDESEPEESVPIIREVVIPPLVNSTQKTDINKVEIKPACVEGYNGGELYFNVRLVPNNFTVLIREWDSDYKVVIQSKGLYEKHYYFAVCDECREGDFHLAKDSAYILKIKFDYTKKYTNFQFSDEYLIDTRNESLYMKKDCKQDKIILRDW